MGGIASNGDFPIAAGIQAAAHTAASAASWVSRLALPAAEAAATLGLMQYKKNQFDDIEDRRIRFLDNAVSQFCVCMNEIRADIRNATDDIPEPAMYQPVSVFQEQWNTALENIEAMPAMAQYARDVSKNNRDSDLIRAVILNPSYYELSEITWSSIGDLMKGILPVGLTVETLTNSANTSITTGRLGRAHGQFRRNVGIIDYRIQKEARQEQRLERSSQNQDVSSLQRQGDVREMVVSPQERVGYALQQAQLLQNSLQNANNACARKPPALLQELQIELTKCQQQLQLEASKAGIIGGFVPDVTSIFNTQIRDAVKSLFNSDESNSVLNNQSAIGGLRSFDAGGAVSDSK